VILIVAPAIGSFERTSRIRASSTNHCQSSTNSLTLSARAIPLLHIRYLQVRDRLVAANLVAAAYFLDRTASYSTMTCLAPIRFAAAGLALSALLSAQTPQTPQSKPPASTQALSTLPATQPTVPEQPQVPLTPMQRPPQPARVTFGNGMLSISAENSSLNQILRQISHDTGMKITGGVVDERVFGQYGPATPADVLAQLLDGTGSNMILEHRDGEANAELILTPRHGGPTPPNPNAAAFDDRPQPQQTRLPQPDQNPSAPLPGVPPASVGETTPANPPGNATQPDSPNGVKTPQEIYEQLQRMRQQQQQQTPPQ